MFNTRAVDSFFQSAKPLNLIYYDLLDYGRI